MQKNMQKDKKLNTHLKLDNDLNGTVVELKNNYAKVQLVTKSIMSADEQGLVHGGFIFCAADYAAMACINDPYVVLAKSTTKFISPVKVGQTIIFEANLISSDKNKFTVEVVGKVEQKDVFKGEFLTAVLKEHVLKM